MAYRVTTTALCVLLAGAVAYGASSRDAAATTTADECSQDGGYSSFTVTTGFVFTAPADTLALVPGTLQLSHCLALCRANVSCRAVNFETGLCVLFSSHAGQRPAALAPSQFPVFTIYGHRICMPGSLQSRCPRDWSFEEVRDHALEGPVARAVRAESPELCMAACLGEPSCRAANFQPGQADCQLLTVDRHSSDARFGPSQGVLYLENNCVDAVPKLCEFRKVSGKILKTVDAVYQDITTLDGCRRKCLQIEQRCQSFDLGDPATSVCRLSHLAAASLSHIQDPYLDIPGAATYELDSCYNVTILCRAREMVTRVRTSKLFNGKVYVKSRPNACVTDVVDSLEFEIRMTYNDVNCDVKQQSSGQFSTDLVIQHHDLIVTTQDVGLSVHCQYDLANKTVAHGVQMEVAGDVDTAGTSQSAVVESPNVTLHITDRWGQDVYSAQVGDPLALRFQVAGEGSPFEIFVRELVALDGVDNSEILLVDSEGCPTDPAIMGAVEKVNGNGQILQAPFDAFKFPTSEVVQFKAVVTPCLASCPPAQCGDSQSLGRRRKRAADDNVLVYQTIRITDKFGFERTQRKLSRPSHRSATHNRNGEDSSSPCVPITILVLAFTAFVITQLLVFAAWMYLWRRRQLDFGIKPMTSAASNPGFVESPRPSNVGLNYG